MYTRLRGGALRACHHRDANGYLRLHCSRLPHRNHATTSTTRVASPTTTTDADHNHHNNSTRHHDSQPQQRPIRRIRNIGILAHIDAGKTTTTERMLYYAGKTHQLGEVHHGTTVTDCLAQERERGITICSAAVSFDWHCTTPPPPAPATASNDNNDAGAPFRFNLLDTPGHIDFTMEVEQSLAACDGGVVILDGSAGVEVQTLTVWSQADRQRLPRLIFVNKMDRRDADFEASLADVRHKLNVQPVAVQWPVYDAAAAAAGHHGCSAIVDLVRLELMRFSAAGDRRCQRTPLAGEQLHEARDRRAQLIDALCTHDDALAEAIIASGDWNAVRPEQIVGALRAATLRRQLVPVLLGAAYKNCGVQPLLDACAAYLPAPCDRNAAFDCFARGDLAARVFKVTHDRQRGALCAVRVLRGRLRRGARVSTSAGQAEHVQRVYEPLADELAEVQQVGEGDVAIVAGLKTACTGDLLVSSGASLRAAQRRLMRSSGKQTTTAAEVPHDGDDDDDHSDNMLDTVSVAALGLQPRIPDAVYFCSVEPPSQAQQLALETALRQMQREDPSLRVRYDESTMQTVLGGMGELHLDIVRSRLLSEHRIDADLGPLQIAYRETLTDADGALRRSVLLEKEIAGAKQMVHVELALVKGGAEAFRLDSTPEATQRLSLVRPRFVGAVRKAALAALERGPKLGGPVADVQIVLHDLRIGRGTADSFVMAATAQCVQQCLLAADCRLLEPIMALQIVLPAARTPAVIADLGKRRASILDVGAIGRGGGGGGDERRIIEVLAPLAELAGYSSALRIISSGTASVSMQPHDYAPMTAAEEASAIRRAQGLE